jgi:putative toxin-antitoxin system antitoxin component (TIGR02293 family)
MARHATATRQLVTRLGGPRAFRGRIQNIEQLRRQVRTGFPFAVLAALSDAYEIDLTTLALVVGIPERTLARRKQDRRLRADESDRVFRVARIAALAEEALGSRAKAAHWLQRPNRALGRATPLANLDTDLGARQVEDVLGRIAHGVYS